MTHCGLSSSFSQAPLIATLKGTRRENGDESSDSGGRFGNPPQRRDLCSAEAHGRNRRTAILWHILKTYSHYGITDFIICAGYKAHMISEWFVNYRLRTADVTFDFSDHSVNYHDDSAEKWKVGVCTPARTR